MSKLRVSLHADRALETDDVRLSHVALANCADTRPWANLTRYSKRIKQSAHHDRDQIEQNRIDN